MSAEDRQSDERFWEEFTRQLEENKRQQKAKEATEKYNRRYKELMRTKGEEPIPSAEPVSDFSVLSRSRRHSSPILPQQHEPSLVPATSLSKDFR